MKLSLLAAAAIAQIASAHYFFELLVIDGVESKPYEFVRENTRAIKYNPTKWKNPLDNITPDDTDFRCNKGAFASAGRTGVAEVKPGTKLAMKLGVGATMKHPGPGHVHMSLAKGSVKEYEGDGDWFLIKQVGLCTKGDIKGDAWCTWDKNSIEFDIPIGTPPGEYLVRSQHVGVHGAHDGQAEFYYGCAQIKVTGDGTGVPGPMIKFPGGYKKTDPSWNFSVWGGYKDFPFPSQTVWTGGNSGGAQSPAQSPAASPSAVASNPQATPAAPAPKPQPTKPATPVSQPAGVPVTQPSSAPVEQAPSDDYPADGGDYPAGGDYPTEEAPKPTPATPSPATPATTKRPCSSKKTRRGSRAFRQSLRK